ncbi:MAG: ribosome biogenesis GTP-binding protein YihA/YsxC [Chitinophagaceae bacterium]|nr:ribosome biogenesis GTP-binding protein YihA/YsxC [Chitinophagaceae bacterium]
MRIHSAKYLISSPSLSACPELKGPEYAFIGRSNVGKSSLINMITGCKNLAKTSSVPGKTRLINHFEIISCNDKKTKEINLKRKLSKWFIVDLPGYGYASVSLRERQNFLRMIEEYLRFRKNLNHIFLLIDARHEPQKIDIDFAFNLRQWKKNFSLIFTKTDKVKETAFIKNLNLFTEILKNSDIRYHRIFATSVPKKAGKEEILTFLDLLNNEFSTKL